MTAWLFRIHRLEDGRHAAWGLICAGARYASVSLPGVAHFARRHAGPATWRQIEHEVSGGLEAGPLPAASAISRLLIVADPVNAKGFVVQYVTAREVDSAAPAVVLATLDAFLREQPQAAA